MADLTPLIARIMSGAEIDVEREIGPLESGELLRQAAEHDVIPLVAERLRHASIPTGLSDALKEQARAAAVVDLVREREIRRCLEACDRAGVHALLVKGSHLAYTHYARPDLRARVDSDLLVPAAAVSDMHRVMTDELGYTSSHRGAQDLTSPQRSYFRHTPQGTIAFDVHWEIASPRVFATMPSHETLAAHAVPLPQFGPGSRVPCPSDALLIACVHRVAHHLDAPDLKWLFDIHLIASRLTSDEWHRFASDARAHRVARVCRRGLEAASHWFGTPLPEGVRSGEMLDANDDEPSAVYLDGRPMYARVLADAHMLPWGGRLRLLLEHLVPPAAYMRTVYAPSSRVPLPFLYVFRVLRGAGGWFRRQPPAHGHPADKRSV